MLSATVVLILEFVFRKPTPPTDSPLDLGLGVLVIAAVLNTFVATFIAAVSVFVNLHHQTSWLTPTLAFASCIVAIRLLGPIDIQFAPFMLGGGTLTWLASCWLLRLQRRVPRQNVIEA
jgi:hypothetical protein